MNSSFTVEPKSHPVDLGKRLFTPSARSHITDKNSNSKNNPHTEPQPGSKIHRFKKTTQKNRNDPPGYQYHSTIFHPLFIFTSLQKQSSDGTNTSKRAANLEARSRTSELGDRGTGHATRGRSSAGCDGNHGVSSADGRRVGDHGDTGAAHDGGGGGGRGGGVVGRGHGGSDGGVRQSPE
jgi:hypothetical protein